MRKAVLFIALAVSLVLAACGGKQPDPVDLITSAAEETSAVETTAEETAAEAESIVAEMPSIEGETVAVYEYEVFDDAEPHKITYWTDDVTRSVMSFTNLMIPEWGIEKIALPSKMRDGREVYHLQPGEVIANEKFSMDLLYDDSVNYNGCYSIRDYMGVFRTWRARFDIEKPDAATPAELFIAAYPFSDIENFSVDNKSIINLVNNDGTVDYLLTVLDDNHWADSEGANYAYGGRVLLRPRGDVVHCVMFTCSDLENDKLMDYVFFNSLKMTDVDEITEGEVCVRE